MKRGAIALAVVGLLLFADGSYLIASKNQVGGDTGVLFGNPHFPLSAGTVVVISSLLLILGAAVMWAVAVWRETRPAGGGERVSQAQVSKATTSETQVSERPASDAQVSEPPASDAQVSEPPASDAQVSQAPVSQTAASDAPAQAGAGSGQAGKGQSHQRQS